MQTEPLKRDDIISVIEGKGCASRVPNMVQLWVHPENFGDDEPMIREIMDRYPLDCRRIRFRMPGVYDAPSDDPSFRYMNVDAPAGLEEQGLDAHSCISDWAQLDDILADWPSADYPGLFPDNPPEDGRYRLGNWFFCFFERHWSLRGMTNALMDFYTDGEQVHRLYGALADFYCGVLERARHELNIDGVFTSDDLGTQTGPFFSPDIFDEFFAPYYKQIIDKAHSLGMHFWLHCCGNIVPFIPKFIDLGLDVLHPIQKYTMDEKEIADRFGGDICIFAGFDVQQTIPWGTVEDVRKEVRFMIDTYFRPEGRLLITAGNGVNQDCPPASLDALMHETIEYGTRVCRERGSK